MSYQAWGSTIAVTSAAGADDARVAGIGSDRFVLVWEDTAQNGGDASGSAIRLRGFDPFGVGFGATVLVNTTTVGSQANAQVLGLESGEFVVVWEDNSATGGDTSGVALRGQRFSSDFQKLGTEFLVNTTTTGSQTGVTLAKNGTGFVAAWVDASAGHTDIRAQRFDATATKLGSEFVVGGTAGNQTQVKAADTFGGFGLAWATDDDGGGSIDSIRVRTFSADGTARGTEGSIVTSAAGLQAVVDVARIGTEGNIAVGYQEGTGQVAITHTLEVDVFNSEGARVASDVPMGGVGIGYVMQGLQFASRDGVTLEPGVFARGDADFMTGNGGLTVGSLVRGSEGFPDQTEVRDSSAALAPTVHDVSVLEDGRVVVANRETDGRITFTIADGRGANVAATLADGPTVLVGADAGPDANNTMIGSHLVDTLYGLGGNDYLYGFAGIDVLLGGAGNDNLYGEGGDDYLYGEGGDNVMVGGAGVDVFISQGASDTMYGGEGGDYFYTYGTAPTLALGEAGNDIFVMQKGPASAYGGDGQDYFYMGAFNDTMDGGAGVDVLQGGGGADHYDGGAGVDYLFLNSGADTVLMNLQSGVDVVNDFSVAQDVVRFVGTGFTSAAQVRAAMTDYGSFTVVTVDANTAVWLVGLAPAQFADNNFQFS